MIFAKDTDGKLVYLLPEGPPPTSITWSLYDPDGNAALASQTVDPPTAYTVSSGTQNNSPDDVTLTCAEAPTEVGPGDIARVLDTWNAYHDGLCYGRNGTDLRVADVPHTLADEPSTVYNPEVEIEIPASALDETGNGWRLDVTIVQGGETIKDTLWPSVGLYLVQMQVSPREVMDRFPAIRSDLAHLETRRDWPRVIRRAVTMVENSILGTEKWYTQLVSPTGLRNAVAAAAWMILAPTAVPENYDAAEWGRDAERTYTEAISILLSSAYTDKDLSGTIETDERNPLANQFELVR